MVHTTVMYLINVQCREKCMKIWRDSLENVCNETKNRKKERYNKRRPEKLRNLTLNFYRFHQKRKPYNLNARQQRRYITLKVIEILGKRISRI